MPDGAGEFRTEKENDVGIDLNHLRRWVGRETQTEELLTAATVARFNATFNRDPAPETDDEAPPLIHFCLCQSVVPTARLDSDGHPERGDFLPPVPLPRRMWAGGVLEFHDPIYIGEVVTRRSAVADIALREGRSGPLCFVTVTHEIRSGGRLAVTERQDIVYRAPSTVAGSIPAMAEIAPCGNATRRVTPSEPLLFRYSALTFNSHRIHYDQPYARNEEDYAGLVVHGPLQATLLALFARDLRGVPPARFEFRSKAPILAPAAFMLHATEDGGGLSLWTAASGGGVAMQARASW